MCWPILSLVAPQAVNIQVGLDTLVANRLFESKLVMSALCAAFLRDESWTIQLLGLPV